MALRLAQEGAAVVITGKSEQPTETLPGSIHTVVEEIYAAGGRAIAVRLDVRKEDEVAAMVQHTVDELGSLDILVNNAGALWWKPMLETPVKRYDLMWGGQRARLIHLRAAGIASGGLPRSSPTRLPRSSAANRRP